MFQKPLVTIELEEYQKLKEVTHSTRPTDEQIEVTFNSLTQALKEIPFVGLEKTRERLELGYSISSPLLEK